MAYNTLTDINIANMALRNLGEDPIVTFTEATKRAQAMNEHYATVRDATLRMHHWNFAMKRVVIDAFTEPTADLTLGATSGTAVQFTASANLWSTADIGKVIRHETLAGEAEIIALANLTQATAEITSTFSSVGPFLAGVWRLFNIPPAWGFGNTFLLPSDFLRTHQLDDDIEYQLEGEGILADGESINMRYIAKITDPTKWSPLFVTAFIAHLTALVAEPITGQLAKADHWMKVFQLRLAEAQGYDALEGTRDIVAPAPLLDVRL